MRLLLAGALVLVASTARADALVGVAVSGNWIGDSDVSWYGNVIGSGAYWRGPIGVVVDGGLSATGADRGQLWGGAALRVSPWQASFEITRPGYFRPWLEAGAGYERWAARDDEHPVVSRRVLRAAVGYDLAERDGWGTQAYVRLLRGDAIEDGMTTELAATTFVIGIGVVRDL